VEKLVAGLTLAACLVMLARMLIGAPRRSRLDALLQRWWWATRRRALLIWHWRSARQHAAKAAEEAIRRARASGEWDGKVYRPDAFHKKPPNDKLH
jgi:type IV pilus biogenesis protein CpaD/CtpE